MTLQTHSTLSSPGHAARSNRRGPSRTAAALLALCACAAAAPSAPAQPQQGDPGLEQILQSAPKGKLTIKAVLVSNGSTSPVPGIEAAVYLFHDNKAFKQLKVLLDEHGSAVMEDLPVVMGVVPLVRVEYKGLTYQEAAPPMDASNKDASVEVRVYDSTDQTPAWHIPMRHVMAKTTPAGLAVSETVIVENPSDKTWTGLNPPDDKGNRPTVELTLPKNAADVTLESGFHGWCCTTYEGGDLHIKMPLMPGQARFKFSYTLPPTPAGELLSVASPVPVDHMMFLIDDDGTTVSPAPGADVQPVIGGSEEIKARMFQCSALQPGQAAGLLISGKPTAAVAASQPWENGPIVIAVAAGGAVVLAGIIAWRRKRATLATPKHMRVG